jgi:hypothetical protein
MTVKAITQSTKEHSIGLDCLCFKDKRPWIQSINMHGYTLGAVWNNDGSIFCWLCMIDEFELSTPLHHTVRQMYSSEDFMEHIHMDHIQGKGWKKYTPRLPEDVLYGHEWKDKKKRNKRK